MAGAVCPRHLEQQARRACARCGTFMCDTCAEGGTQALCPECRERAGLRAFPLTRANWNFGALWDVCWESFKRDWLMLSLGALCLLVLSAIIQLVAGILPLLGTALESPVLYGVLTAISMALQTVLQGVLALGFLRMCFEVLHGQKADVGRLFTQLHKTSTYFVSVLLVMLMVGLPLAVVAGGAVGAVYALGGFGDETLMLGVLGATFVLLLPFLLYFTIPLWLLQPALALADGPMSPTELIRHCYTVSRGERLSMFGVMMVGVLVILAGMLACCVGFIPASALFQLLLAGLYLALRDEGDGEGVRASSY